jgi:hypothetical protein
MCDAIDLAAAEQFCCYPIGKPAGASVRPKRIDGDMADIGSLKPPDAGIEGRGLREAFGRDVVFVRGRWRKGALARKQI